MQRLLGIIAGLIGAFFFSSEMGCVKYVYSSYPSVPLSGAQVQFVRGIFTIACVGILMAFGKVLPFEDPKELKSLFLIGAAKGTSLLFGNSALVIVSVGTYAVLSTTQSVFTVFFAWILLKERCSLFNAIVGVLSLVGIVFIVVPNIVMKNQKPEVSSTALVYNSEDQNHESAFQYCFGIILSMLCIMLISLYFVAGRSATSNNFDYKLVVLYPSLVGIVISPLAMLVFQESLVLDDLPTKGWLILLISSFASFLGEFFTAMSLKYEQAGIVSFLISTEVFWCYMYDIYIGHIIPNVYSSIGIVTVVLFTSLLSLNRIFMLEKRIKCCG